MNDARVNFKRFPLAKERTICASLRMTEGLGLIRYIKIHNDDQNIKKKNTNSKQQKSLLRTNYLQERGAWALAHTLVRCVI